MPILSCKNMCQSWISKEKSEKKANLMSLEISCRLRHYFTATVKTHGPGGVLKEKHVLAMLFFFPIFFFFFLLDPCPSVGINDTLLPHANCFC